MARRYPPYDIHSRRSMLSFEMDENPNTTGDEDEVDCFAEMFPFHAMNGILSHQMNKMEEELKKMAESFKAMRANHEQLYVECKKQLELFQLKGNNKCVIYQNFPECPDEELNRGNGLELKLLAANELKKRLKVSVRCRDIEDVYRIENCPNRSVMIKFYRSKTQRKVIAAALMNKRFAVEHRVWRDPIPSA